jgi:hypothetical protein
MTRYTPEDGKKFLEEEERRNAEETAAYFAWKRGEAPLDSTPTYIPPNPSNPQSFAPPSQEFASADAEPSAPTTPGIGAEEEGPMKHLFDDPLFGEDGRKNGEKVNIDEVDVDDQSPEGRKSRMRAMADELSGFSAGQVRDAEKWEEERAREGVQRGRGVRDEYGTRFDETPGSKTPRR